jgi:CheY-like chemotaxis protein
MGDARAERSNTRSILIVDDDVDIRETLADFLEDEGYSVGAAANGREALAYLREHLSTSVVLLDLMMPVMDGFKFRAEQKNDPELASIPVVVMTARGPMEPGAIDVQDIVPKPMKLDTLLGAIQRAIESPPTRKSPPPPGQRANSSAADSPTTVPSPSRGGPFATSQVAPSASSTQPSRPPRKS